MNRGFLLKTGLNLPLTIWGSSETREPLMNPNDTIFSKKMLYKMRDWTMTLR